MRYQTIFSIITIALVQSCALFDYIPDNRFFDLEAEVLDLNPEVKPEWISDNAVLLKTTLWSKEEPYYFDFHPYKNSHLWKRQMNQIQLDIFNIKGKFIDSRNYRLSPTWKSAKYAPPYKKVHLDTLSFDWIGLEKGKIGILVNKKKYKLVDSDICYSRFDSRFVKIPDNIPNHATFTQGCGPHGGPCSMSWRSYIGEIQEVKANVFRSYDENGNFKKEYYTKIYPKTEFDTITYRYKKESKFLPRKEETHFTPKPYGEWYQVGYTTYENNKVKKVDMVMKNSFLGSHLKLYHDSLYIDDKAVWKNEFKLKESTLEEVSTVMSVSQINVNNFTADTKVTLVEFTSYQNLFKKVQAESKKKKFHLAIFRSYKYEKYTYRILCFNQEGKLIEFAQW